MKALFFFLLATPVLLLSSCAKEADVINCRAEITKPDTTITKSNQINIDLFFRKNRTPSRFYPFDISQGATINTDKNTTIIIPPLAFGGTITTNSGLAQLEVREITKTSEMVLNDMPTTSFGEVLTSGGEFYLRVTQNGKDLVLRPGAAVTMRVHGTQTSVLPTMRLYFGQPTQTGINWVPESLVNTGSSLIRDSTNFISQGVPITNYFYKATIKNDSLRWINFDQPTPNTRVPVAINIRGDKATDTNTVAYLLFNNLRGAVRSFNVNNNAFNFTVPQGYFITAVVIRFIDGQFYFGKQTSMSVAGVVCNPILQAVTEAELISEINKL